MLSSALCLAVHLWCWSHQVCHSRYLSSLFLCHGSLLFFYYIGKRLSSIPSNPAVFADTAPLYQQALVSSGYNEKIQYSGNQGTRKRQRKRNITWFNPPFSKSVSTDVARRFLRLLDRHFPKKSELHKLFNRSTVKVSYSTMPSMARIIFKKNLNTEIMNSDTGCDRPDVTNGPTKQLTSCKCRVKQSCPLNGRCLTESIVYRAEVCQAGNDIVKMYTELTEGNFKQRYNNHLSIFRHQKSVREQYRTFEIHLAKEERQWKVWCEVVDCTASKAILKRRVLALWSVCTTEKLKISDEEKSLSLNKRSELVTKCRHENKYIIANFIPTVT